MTEDRNEERTGRTGQEYFTWAMGNIEKRLAFFQKWNQTNAPTLHREVKRLLNHYGIRTGYLPPDFKIKAQDVHGILRNLSKIQ